MAPSTEGSSKSSPEVTDSEVEILRRSLAEAKRDEEEAKERVRRLTRAIDILEKPRSLAIAPERLSAVRAYVQQNSPCRQSDIGRALDMNAGSVSVAMRTLAEEGVARMIGKQDRSQLWEWIGETAVAAKGGRVKVNTGAAGARRGRTRA